jgi:hypothetical protein
MLVAGMLLILMVSSGALVHFGLAGNVFSILMLLLGALLMVLLALACGVLTKTSRTFEGVFMMLWYMGPLNHATYLDFIGGDIELSKQINVPLVFLSASASASALLSVIAYIARRKQLSI